MFQVLHTRRGPEGNAIGHPTALGDTIRQNGHRLERAAPEGRNTATPVWIFACDEECMHNPVRAWGRFVAPIDSFLPTARVRLLCRLGCHVHVGRLVLAKRISLVELVVPGVQARPVDALRVASWRVEELRRELPACAVMSSQQDPSTVGVVYIPYSQEQVTVTGQGCLAASPPVIF